MIHKKIKENNEMLGFIKFHGGGGVIKSVGEEYQVVKRRKGSQYHLHYKTGAAGKNID